MAAMINKSSIGPTKVQYYIRERYFTPTVAELPFEEILQALTCTPAQKSIIVCHGGIRDAVQGFPIPSTLIPYIDWIDGHVFDILRYRYSNFNDENERAYIQREIENALNEKVRSSEFSNLRIICDFRNNGNKFIALGCFAVTLYVTFRGVYVQLVSNYTMGPTDFIDEYVIRPIAKAPLVVRDLHPIGV